MKNIKMKHYIKKVIPAFALNYLIEKNKRKNIDFEFANFILTSAIIYHIKIT